MVVGAGAVGGYFGARLLEAGRDVTFLVRARRNEQLARTGLVVRSKYGDIDMPAPTVTTDAIGSKADLIILSCKAYDLASAMDSLEPAVGENTAIVPLLNGMQHIDALQARFGKDAVMGGQCIISAALDDEGHVIHLNEAHSLTFGEIEKRSSERATMILNTLSNAKFEVKLSEVMLQDMWEKWFFIAVGAGITCLMRSNIGDIVAAGATDVVLSLLDECAAIAAHNGFAPREAALQRCRTMFTMAGSSMAASMLRDIERGSATEGDHVLGDLLRRADKKAPAESVLRTAYAHLMTYEARRARPGGLSDAV